VSARGAQGGTHPPPQPATPPRRPGPPTPGFAQAGAAAAAAARPGVSSAPPIHQPAPAATNPMPQMGSAGPTLFLIYNGQRYPVTKDQFIIGRGSKTSDLPIKDGNISRKHAAVIRRNGTFYIKDLGSTNGIDYKGMRIDNKRIDEGDVFHLCDYELRFTYRAD
jgi:pSer/pThr/pTyr-binding forkhead associated (FHA) protein